MTNRPRLILAKATILLKAALKRFLPGWNRHICIAPYLATITVTDNCCLRCIMCNEWRQPHPHELTTAQWKDVIAQLGEIGIQEINFTGGEPLMRLDLPELVRYASGRGLKVGLTTNGLLLNAEKIRQLITDGVKGFTVSLDAVGGAFDDIRGVPGAYEKVYQACQALSEFRKSHGIDVYLAFLLMKKTLPYYRDVVAVAEDLRFPITVNLFDANSYFFTLPQGKEPFWLGSDDQTALKEFQKFFVKKKTVSPQSQYHSFREIDFWREYFDNPRSPHIPCLVSQSRICIDAKGQVYGGCWALGPYGNVSQIPLRQIIQSPGYRRAHQQMFVKQCPGCSCGYSANLRYSLPDLVRQLRYKIFPKTRERIWKK